MRNINLLPKLLLAEPVLINPLIKANKTIRLQAKVEHHWSLNWQLGTQKRHNDGHVEQSARFVNGQYNNFVEIILTRVPIIESEKVRLQWKWNNDDHWDCHLE